MISGFISFIGQLGQCRLLSLCVDAQAIVASYTEHGSLAYGVDWCHKAIDTVIASCSFYDHLLRLWKAG